MSTHVDLQAEAFVRDGFLVVEELVSATELDAIRSDAERFATGRYPVTNLDLSADETPEILAIHFPPWVSDVAMDMVEHPGIVDVHVTTAVPLSDGLRQELAQATERLTGSKPEIIATVDESLIGGLVVRVGDRKIDTSIVAGLRKMRQALGERSAREIHASRSADRG